MVDLSSWQSSAVQWAVKFGAIVLVILAVVIVGGIIVGVAWFRNMAKQYSKHRVVVWQEYTDPKGNKVPMWVDLDEKGRFFYDKKLKRIFFHLKNANHRMGEYEGDATNAEFSESTLPKTPYLKGGEVVFIKKLGYKNYAFAKPIMFEGDIKTIVGQADLAEASASYDSNVKDFGKQPNQIMTMLFYFGICVFAMIIIYIVFQKVDTMKELVAAQGANNQVLLEVVRALKGSAIPSAVPG